LKIEIFLKRVSPFDTDVLQNRHNCKNGPVVEPTNFELGITGDRELENWARCYTKKLIKS